MSKRRRGDEIAEEFAALMAHAEELRTAGEKTSGATFRVDRLVWMKDAKRRAMRCPKEREYE